MVLAYSKYLQNEDFQSNNTQSILENQYRQINEIIPVDRLFVLDNNGIAKMNVVSKESSNSYWNQFFKQRNGNPNKKYIITSISLMVIKGLMENIKLELLIPSL